MLQRVWLIPAFVCVFPMSVWALDPNRQISQYAHAAWRIQDGLFSSGPRTVVQTNDGYLWVGTDAGSCDLTGCASFPGAQGMDSGCPRPRFIPFWPQATEACGLPPWPV